MTTLNQVFSPPGWPGVYQIETGDPVLGGVNGIANLQAKALVERTEFLKAQRGANGGTCELDAAGFVPANRFPSVAKAVSLYFVGTQTLATSVFTTVTLTPSITTCDLFDWTAGMFTFKKSGTYRISSNMHFAISQPSGLCSAFLAHVYTLGAGNSTAFSVAPVIYNNNKVATSYVGPGGSSGGDSLFHLHCDAVTPMGLGDKLSLQAYTDSNAATFRRIGDSSIGKNILTIQFLG
jgi:hypothetical protein